MKRSLIINRGSDTDNIGDEAINYALKSYCLSENSIVDEVNLTTFFKRTSSNKFLGFVKKLKEAINLVRSKYDVVIIGGGQLIQSNRLFPKSILLWTLIIKLFSRSKLVVYGVGVDDNFNKSAKFCFQFLFNKSNSIYVRDEISKATLKQIFNKESNVIADPVFGISKIYDKTNSLQNTILLGITSYDSVKRYKFINLTKEEYYDSQYLKIQEYLSQGEVKFIYNTNSDLQHTIELQKYIAEKYNCEIEIIEYRNLCEYLDIISSSKKVISSRMHALIIAKSYGVEVEVVIRNKKLETFANYINTIDIKSVYEKNRNTLSKIINNDN